MEDKLIEGYKGYTLRDFRKDYPYQLNQTLLVVREDKSSDGMLGMAGEQQ